jgi:hypothetical protein
MSAHDDDEILTDSGRAMQAANLFDLRRIIGGLFLLYGIVLTILGLTDSDAEVAKAAGVRINLWAGLGMIAFALLFIAWSVWRPLGRELVEAEGEGDGEADDEPGGG